MKTATTILTALTVATSAIAADAPKTPGPLATAPNIPASTLTVGESYVLKFLNDKGECANVREFKILNKATFDKGGGDVYKVELPAPNKPGDPLSTILDPRFICGVAKWEGKK